MKKFQGGRKGGNSPVFMSTRVWYRRVGGILSKSGTAPSCPHTYWSRSRCDYQGICRVREEGGRERRDGR